MDLNNILLSNNHIKKMLSNETSMVMLGNSLEILKDIKPNSVDLIFADPPYNIGKNFGNNNDFWENVDSYIAWCKVWIDECLLFLKNTKNRAFALFFRLSCFVFSVTLQKTPEKEQQIMEIYAYARVSARDQNLARQLDAFAEFGIEKSHIYADKKSGKDFERKSYGRLLRKLRKGDLLVIKSIDRLGRNYDQIIAEWARIVNALGADIFVLDMPLLDTRTKADTLIGKFISDIVLQVLSFVAENERANIKARQAEGIKAAKMRGVRFGRPKVIYSEKFLSAVSAYETGRHGGKAVTLQSAAALAGMTLSNFYYHYRNYLSLRQNAI